MNQVLKLVCLANSRRPGGRCLAGKIVEGEFAGRWIRPVKNTVEGTLALRDYICDTGDEPVLLDELLIPFNELAPKIYQTENVLIDTCTKWLKIGRLDFDHLAGYCDSPGTLWTNDSESHFGINDRVYARDAIHTLRNSLYLIQPDELEFLVQEEYNRIRVRARFTYRSIDYNLVVTDPCIERSMKSEGEGVYNFDCGEVYLTISLTLPFEDYAYKLVAAGIGLEL